MTNRSGFPLVDEELSFFSQGCQWAWADSDRMPLFRFRYQELKNPLPKKSEGMNPAATEVVRL
jgi:hypothetical protein